MDRSKWRQLGETAVLTDGQKILNVQVEYLKNGAFWDKVTMNTNRKTYTIYRMVH